MSETAETLDRNELAGGDLHLAHAVEDGDAGAEEGRVGGGIDIGGNVDNGLGAEDAVFCNCVQGR